MLIASLILDIPTQSLDRLFSYLVPDEIENAQVGCAAVVSFGSRPAIGYIVEIEDCDSARMEERGLDPKKLKAIWQVASKPYFDADGAACASFLSNEYLAPLSRCIRLFIPPGAVPRAVKGIGGWRIEEPRIGEVDDRYVSLTEEGRAYEPKASAVRQREIVDALRAGELRVAELRREFGSVSQVLKTLETKGIVHIESRRRSRALAAQGEFEKSGVAAKGASSRDELSYTEGQREALSVISSALEAENGQVVLVDGITGSGKTEVYLRAIEPVIAAGKSAIVLVPEISLTPQTVSRFRGRFGDTVAVIHSRMSAGERYDEWDRIRSGEARVVVGARSALFTPVSRLGIIVIDEEHEGSYKQDSSPRYHARDVARWMVKRHHATLVLGSATPSIEALQACATQRDWTRVELPERANGKPLPAVDVVDMAQEFRGGSRAMFSRKLENMLRACLERGEKAILLLNQRGFARFVLCRNCGFVPECPHCATSLTYHEYEGLLICHHCGHIEHMPPRCPQCESPYLRLFGAGTERVEMELRALLDSFGLAAVPIIRMDADTTRKKGSHRALLEEFMAPGASVLLGTQMIAKGHDFSEVTLVGVINADTTLKLPDFRSAESTYELIEQVSGRAGRGNLEGHVLVQTYWPDSSAIRAAAAHDRAMFLREEIPKRKALRYPPYARMANLLIWGKDLEEVKRRAQEAYAALSELLKRKGLSDWAVFPPTDCVLAKLRGNHRLHIVVKAAPHTEMGPVIREALMQVQRDSSARIAVDIDPVNML